MVLEFFSDDDATNFDDVPDPDSGEEFFPTPQVGFEVSPVHVMLWHIFNLSCTLLIDRHNN